MNLIRKADLENEMKDTVSDIHLMKAILYYDAKNSFVYPS